MPKIFRSHAEKFEIATDIAALIPVGADYAMSVNRLAVAMQDKYRGDKSAQAFSKEIARICDKLYAEHHDDESREGLSRLASAGTPTRYYWQDKASKTHCLEQFTITRPRALALLLARQHVCALLPQQYLSALDEDLQKAQMKLSDDGVNLTEVLDYSPNGVILNQPMQPLAEHEQVIFDCIFESLMARQVLDIGYHSIHSRYQQSGLTLSPIKLRYIANQLQLMAYVHQTGLIKHFSLAKIQYARNNEELRYHAVKLDKYSHQYPLKVVCHSWVKEQLLSNPLGTTWVVREVSEDVWQLETNVEFPSHFESHRADGFYLANFFFRFC